MTDLLDPVPAYFILFTGLILVSLGLGYTARGGLGILGSVIFAGFLGFLAGLYTRREETDIFASLVLAGGLTAVAAWFLPLSLNWSIAVFLVGFIVGMRTERR